jgi:hypothetical protein
MNDIREALILIFLWLMVAGYVLLALLLFARVLSAFVGQWRADGRSVKGRAHAHGLDRRADVVFKSGVHGLLNGGRNVHPWAPARVHAVAVPSYAFMIDRASRRP